VEDRVTLTLGTVTLRRRADNAASLIMVYSGGRLVMRDGGTISGNTVSGYGGGVYMNETPAASNGPLSTFTKTGGIIYGSDASTELKNTTTHTTPDNYGHAVYVKLSDSSNKKRNTTAGSGMNLNGTTNSNWE
jgi:hypothetical protein